MHALRDDQGRIPHYRQPLMIPTRLQKVTKWVIKWAIFSQYSEAGGFLYSLGPLFFVFCQWPSWTMILVLQNTATSRVTNGQARGGRLLLPYEFAFLTCDFIGDLHGLRPLQRKNKSKSNHILAEDEQSEAFSCDKYTLYSAVDCPIFAHLCIPPSSNVSAVFLPAMCSLFLVLTGPPAPNSRCGDIYTPGRNIGAPNGAPTPMMPPPPNNVNTPPADVTRPFRALLLLLSLLLLWMSPPKSARRAPSRTFCGVSWRKSLPSCVSSPVLPSLLRSRPITPESAVPPADVAGCCCAVCAACARAYSSRHI